MHSYFLEVGLGIRPLKSINDAALFKLSWNVIAINSQWSCLIKARCFRNRLPCSNYIRSSIWPGLSQFLQSIIDNCCWKLGTGMQINFWSDRWLSQPIVDIMRIPSDMQCSLTAIVVDFIENKAWCIPAALASNCPNIV